MLEGASDMMSISKDTAAKADKIVDESNKNLLQKTCRSNDFESNNSILEMKL